MPRWLQRVGGILIAVGIPTGLILLHLFDPAQSRFFPPCLFHKMTGLYCPGCGSTRAAHALLHGDVIAALGYNLLLVALLPLLAWHGISIVGARRGGRSASSPLSNPFVSWSIVALVIGYSVLRNIPAAPFTALAPHRPAVTTR